MTTKEDYDALHAIGLRLIEWRESRDTRNDDMRRARELGMTVAEIARLTGLARQHVSGIINGHH